MSADTAFWDQRYRQQVRWTAATRRYIFSQIGAQPSHRILEVGCGTGAVLDSLKCDGFTGTIGLDIDFQTLRLAAGFPVTNADAHLLPLPPQSMEICLCHFFLLWAADPQQAFLEMARITKNGGWVIALAEPDYGGRLDFPPELEALGKLQVAALREQGADTSIGRKLKGLFENCGLSEIRTGIISAEWGRDFDQNEFELEWAVLRSDLEGWVPRETLDKTYNTDLRAVQTGRRILFVPIFYAFGRVTN